MWTAITEGFEKFDKSVQEGPVGRFFEMKERKASVLSELRGAACTFMSMAYILAVNPRILSDSGGPCVPDEDGIFGPAYSACVEDIKREYITSTAIASMMGCFFMGMGANLPIALAPGMGMNAYFTYSVVGFRGTGDVAFDAAMTAILIEGIIFLVLAVTGARQLIVKWIPEPVRIATPAAIGAFLAHLGLQTAEGLGLVVADVATAVTLGGCPEEKRTYMVQFDEACQADSSACIPADAYTCDVNGGIMTSATAWAGIGGLLIMLGMLCYKQKSAFIVGIGLVTIISWFRNTELTYFPDTDAGDARFDYFKQVVSIERFDQLLANFTGDLKDAGVALFTFLYVDFLDTSGTLLALVMAMGVSDEKGDFPRSRRAFAADACATIFGSFFGLSPVTSYIESAAGVEAGARTGMTAVLCGIFFCFSIFFAPLIASIPPWAVGGALIIVGCLMARSLKDIKWRDPAHAATAFLTVIIMPLTYSIAYGLLAGIACWIFLQSLFKLLSLIGIERPSFEEEDMEVPDFSTANMTKKEESSEDEVVDAEQQEVSGEAVPADEDKA